MAKVNLDLMKKLKGYSDKKGITSPEMEDESTDEMSGDTWESHIEIARKSPGFDPIAAIKLIVSVSDEIPLEGAMPPMPPEGGAMPMEGMM